jgi:chromosomal replication initiator protein
MTTGLALQDGGGRGGIQTATAGRGADADGVRLSALVTGAWNRLAVEAARRFIESRGAWSRILLVVGGAGAGKSCLLSAIDGGLREAPGRRPALARMGCDDFVKQFTYAVTHGKMAAFRQKFRTLEAFLIDDVDRLANRPATQEEFVHVFDALESAGRSLVMTARTRPREIQGITKGLQSRLAAAMSVRLDPPDADGRRSLLQMAALRDRRPLAADVIDAAAAPPGNVRDVLERWGRLRGLTHITPAAAAASACAPRHAGPTLEGIAAAVAALYGLKTAELSGDSRSRRVTLPRHVCFLLAKRHTKHSLQEIAAFFGGRNHATVLYACRKMGEAMDKDVALKQQVARAERAVAEAGTRSGT